MTKLRAIYKILTNQFYLLITASGSVTGTLPKDLNNLQYMDAIGKTLTEKSIK